MFSRSSTRNYHLPLLTAVAASLCSMVSFGQTFSLAPDLPTNTQSQPVILADDSPMINPAQERSDADATQPTAGQRATAWNMPAVTVVGQPAPALREEELVGSYQQPRWSTDRRFPGVRTYVMPENTVEFEYWFRADVPRHGTAKTRQLFEFEFGLPYRFQLDLYGVARTEADGDSKVFFDQQVELRYAFADWGKIWGNPTLYLEYANRDEKPDKIEAKILLAGELASRWHWGQNFLFEGETGGDREYEYGWTGGLSYTVIDQKLSVGAEAQVSFFDVQNHRGTFHDETMIGPSIQYRPTPRTHLDLAPLFGVDTESPAAKIFFVFGYEF